MKIETKHFTVETTGRLDKVLTQLMPEATRSKIQHWIKSENITVNEQVEKANYKVNTGDKITVIVPEEKVFSVLPEDIPLDIIYEDQDVVVVNKPQGMVVHPSFGHESGTLVNGLLYHVDSLATANPDLTRPGIVHRIDKDTSGLLMVAKNNTAYVSLVQQLKEKTSVRKYVAIVHGTFEHEKGKIKAPIGRASWDRKKQAVTPEGKPAVTHFTVLETYQEYSLIECRLETGRTHQIRVHMDYIGHPVAGDPLYGPKKTLSGHGQFLHAQVLGFTQPTTCEYLEFSVEPPTVFTETCKKLLDFYNQQ